MADEFEDVDPGRFEMGEFGSTSLGGNIFSLTLADCPLALECDDDESTMPGIVEDGSECSNESGPAANTIEPEGESKMSSPFSCLSHVLMCIATAASGLAAALNGNRRALTTAAVCLAAGVDGATL